MYFLTVRKGKRFDKIDGRNNNVAYIAYVLFNIISGKLYLIVLKGSPCCLLFVLLLSV